MTETARIRVLSVDDHPLRGDARWSRAADMRLAARAATGRAAASVQRAEAPTSRPGSRLPDISGIDALIAIRAEFPDARVAILTTFEGDVEIQRALAAGARGYVLKNMPPNDLVEVVRQLHAGKKRIPQEIAAQLAEHVADEALTERERDVLRHVAGGNRNKDIAEQLFISEETVKVHVKHIMEKLGARDRTEAVAIGVRRGIIQL
jgi:DNA-binding NarL/FixJ family response regulator